LLMLAARLRILDRLSWNQIMSKVHKTSLPERESPAKKASRAFWHALYGDHPYGRVLGPGDLRDVPAAQVEAWLPNVYNPRNATPVLVGDFNMATAEFLVSRWFSSWRGIETAGALEVPPVAQPSSGPPHETVLVTHRPIASQVEVLLGCRLPPGH